MIVNILTTKNKWDDVQMIFGIEDGLVVIGALAFAMSNLSIPREVLFFSQKKLSPSLFVIPFAFDN